LADIIGASTLYCTKFTCAGDAHVENCCIYCFIMYLCLKKMFMEYVINDFNPQVFRAIEMVFQTRNEIFKVKNLK